MKKFLLFFSLLFFFYQTQLKANNKRSFSTQELTWIKQHPTITVGGEPDWAPFDFINSQGTYTGISNEYLKLLSQKTGLKFNVIIDKWANNLQKMREKKIDILHAIYYTKERDTYMHYTKSYFEMLDYFFIRDDLNVHTMKDLDGKRIAMPKGYAHAEIIKKEFPKIKIVTVDTFSDAIDTVLAKKAEILFDTYAALSYKLKQEKINTILPFKAYRGKHVAKLHMATNQKIPILKDILDKGLALITKEEKAHIYETWIEHKKPLENTGVPLSFDEQRWLGKNPTITFAGDPDWLPFEAFDEKGRYVGIVADYLKEIEKLLPITFKPQRVKSWQETLSFSKSQKVDVISGDIDDTILSEHYQPITPYFKTPIVIIMKKQHSFISDLEDIKDKRIAFVNGYGYTSQLKSYHDIHFFKEKNALELLSKLNSSYYDAALLTMPVAAYLIKTQGLQDLKIVGKTDILMKPTLFVLKTKPQLQKIIEKAIQNIPYTTSHNILGKWQNVEFAKETDYALLFQIGGLLGLFLLGALYWNRKLSREIDERKKITQELQEKESQIHTLLDNIPLQVLVTDYTGKVFLANPFTYKYFNLDKNELKNANVLDFYANKEERDEILLELQKNGSIHEKIVKFKHPDKSIKNMMISILPITYDKKPRLLSIAVDLTHRLDMEKALSKAKEDADSANKAKSEFLANMSHEIRTPMNSVLGFSELLEKQISDPIQKDYLEAIQRGGKALLSIINDILDLSKIEAGKLDIVLESVDIKQLALEMESIFSVQLIQKNLHFTLDVDPSLPKYLLLDNTRLRQILFNLIGNAIKFTSHGTIVLKIEKTNENIEKSKIDLKINVKDTGIGITKENLNHIFDAFEQQAGQDQKYGGTGLGLAISKKLAIMMKGDISVKSKEAQGSTFTINLYDIPISAIEAEEIGNKISLQHIHFNKATILVVDDIADNRKLVTSTLHEYDFEVVEASNGKEAIQHLQNIKIDLILMDIKMPIMDGYEATKIIKGNDTLKTIPLIALTASVMGKDLDKIQKYQFDGYLRKPISQDGLIEEIARFLAHNILEETSMQEENTPDITAYNLTQIIKCLEQDFTPKWKEIKDMGDFALISDFSQDLEKLGNDKKIRFVQDYAQQLHNNCESFDIDKVDFMMNSFPNMIDKLKGLQDV